MSAPDLTFRNNLPPFDVLSSLDFIQSKIGSGALPVLQGEVSNPVLFRIYNNFARNIGVVQAMNVSITTFDGIGAGSMTASALPSSQSWCEMNQHGFGANSTPLFDLYTRYDGVGTAIGGPNVYSPQKGSNGTYGLPIINAGPGSISGSGVGYIELQAKCRVSPDAPGDDYNFVISVYYEYVP